MSTMDEIEEESKAAAEKMVMNMMQRPGQLEKVTTFNFYTFAICFYNIMFFLNAVLNII